MEWIKGSMPLIAGWLFFFLGIWCSIDGDRDGFLASMVITNVWFAASHVSGRRQ